MTNSSLNFLLFFKRSSFILIFIVFGSTSVYATSPKSPEYIRTKNWKVEKVEAGTLVLSADIVFYNPNKIKARLNDLNLDLYMNDKEIGKLNQAEKIKIKGKNSFDIPIQVNIDLKKSGINISNILGLLSNQKFLVKMTGYLKARVFLMPFKVKIDEQEEFSLKDFF